MASDRSPLTQVAASLLQARLGELPDGLLVIAAPDLPDPVIAADSSVAVDRVAPDAAGNLASRGQGRYSAGVVLDGLVALPVNCGSQLLARLRDQLCRRVYVLSAADGAWQRSEMLALGYTLRERSTCGGWLLFDHDIATYNPERDWNSAEHWAHPERFNRERW